MALASFPMATLGASSTMLITLRRGRPLGLSAAVGVVIKLGANLALIPLFGIAGAAASTLVAVSAQAAVQYRALPRDLGPRWPGWRTVLACLVVCLVAGATVLLPQTLPWNVARFAAGLLCLPWLWLRLKQLRTGSQRRDPGTRGGRRPSRPMPRRAAGEEH